MTTFNIWISDELLQHIFPAGWPAGGGQAALERIGGVPVGARLLWCGLDRDGIVFKCEVSTPIIARNTWLIPDGPPKIGWLDARRVLKWHGTDLERARYDDC